MSVAPKCQLDDGLDADYVIGMTETGEQAFLCAGHAAHFGLTLALRTLEPAEIINAAQAIGVVTVGDGQSAEAPANKPARKRTRKAPPEPPADPQPGSAEVPPAADDQ